MGRPGQARKDDSRVTRALLVGGLALLVAVIVLAVGNALGSARAARDSESIFAELTARMPEQHEEGPTPELEGEKVTMPAEIVGTFTYIGTLAIPALDLELPVGTVPDDVHLRVSPCLYKGSYLTDDMIIVGQGYTSHFGRLRSLGIRDEVRFVTVDGGLHRYIVSNIETDRLEDIEAIIDDWDLTLFTFNEDDTCCVVRCVRAL